MRKQNRRAGRKKRNECNPKLTQSAASKCTRTSPVPLSVRLSIRLRVCLSVCCCLASIESEGVALTNIELSPAHSARSHCLLCFVFCIFCWAFRAERSDKNAAKV